MGLPSLDLQGPAEIFPGYAIVPTGGVITYVHSSGAAALDRLPVGMRQSGDGATYGGFFTSVNAAAATLRANRGDYIICLPGHAETISGANGWSNMVAGVTVLGYGVNTERPTFTFSAAASALALAQNNVRIANCRFTNAAADVTKAFEITGAGVTFDRCYIQASDASNKLTTVMRLSSGADDFTMIDTDIIGGATALTDTCLINAAVTRARFLGVKMIAGLGTGEGLITCATAAATNLEIGASATRRQSIFSNRTAASTVALKGMTGVTGNVDNVFLEVVQGTVTAMNGTTLPEPTLAAALDTPGSLSIGRNVQVAMASGKFAVLGAVVLATLP